MTVLVTGGTGYIGSHTVVELIAAGYDVLVADNLSNSKPEVLARLREITGREIPFVRAELCDPDAVERLFDEHDIGAVIHFAGLKAVGESVEKPLDYYAVNLGTALNVLRAMRRRSVRNFVFSSSATVYGGPHEKPITEDYPYMLANPYGRTKRFIEEILKDLAASDPSFNIAILRYFNPIGAHRSGRIGEDPNGIPNNLLPYVAQVAVGRREYVQVYGDDYNTPDGTGVRDYIHVVDLAKGHVAALHKLESGCGLRIYNLGTGRPASVFDVIRAFERACGRPIPYRILPRRGGDVDQYFADPSLAEKELGWKASLTLDDMCADAWRWQSNNPNGY
ncbi:MAG: UDP-glucose 4-epimerase GalE [Oscillospiraceae bacterium]|nr:UDP-glucose 4-epimerase GalE [Oscillospiraceae bacterium]